jgi:hypothetical protein
MYMYISLGGFHFRQHRSHHVILLPGYFTVFVSFIICMFTFFTYALLGGRHYLYGE